MAAPSGNVREVKLVLLGEAGVGKSSLVLRFVANHFKAYSESTIGCASRACSLPLEQSFWGAHILRPTCLSWGGGAAPPAPDPPWPVCLHAACA